MVCALGSIRQSSISTVKYIHNFVNFVKFVCKLPIGLKFPHTINSPVISRTKEQVVANFLVTSLQTCYEEVGVIANKSARKLRGS